MKIGVIGYGYVGSAVVAAHDRNLIMIHDPYKFEDWAHYSIERIMEECGWIYLCLPTPSMANGACDTSVIEDVLLKLKDYEGIVISKSTAPPKFYTDVQKECGLYKKYKFKFIHMPEFLTAKNALEDYMNPDIIVIGGNMVDVNFVATHVINSDYTYKHKATIVKTDIGSAAAMKYYANSWLATKVVYNNQFAKWCESQGVKWDNVTEVLKADKRLGSSHYNVPGENGDVGYAGACFPKDVAAILKIAEDNDVDMGLLKTQVEINEQLREDQRIEREEAERNRAALPGRRRREDIPRGPTVRPTRRNR